MVSLNHREFNLISWHRYRSDNYQKQLERRNVPLLLRISVTTNYSNIMITTKPRITPGSHIIFLEEIWGENPSKSGKCGSSIGRKYMFRSTVASEKLQKNQVSHVWLVTWSYVIFDVSLRVLFFSSSVCYVTDFKLHITFWYWRHNKTCFENCWIDYEKVMIN